MANTKISQLPAATTLTTGDLLPVVQGGATKQVTLDLLPISTAAAAALAGKDAAGAAAAAQAAAVQRANHTGTQTADTITDGTTNKAYTAAEKTKLAGIASGATANRADTAVDTLLAAKADLVGGLIPSAQIPAIALTNAVTVASQAAMLALTTTQVQPGDIAVRTDGAGTFILTATDPTVLGNWTRLNAPTDAVTTVNGQSGTVVLAKTDIGLGNVDNTSDANKPVSTAQATAIGARLAAAANLSDLASPSAARTNLGLGTAATRPTTDFDPAGTATAVTLSGPAVTLTSAGTLTAGVTNLLDVSGGGFTATLPTPTKVGQLLGIERVDTSTNVLQIAGTIRGTSLTATFTNTGVAGETVLYEAESLTSWRPIASHKPKAWLDALYAPVPLVQTFTGGAYTWTKPAGVNTVHVAMLGGGGGGGSGRRGPSGTAIAGGGGGGGGGYGEAIFPAAALPPTVTGVAGTGGAGGAAITVDATNGAGGTAGIASTFGIYCRASGGNLGNGGTTATATGGNGASGNTSSGSTGGAGTVGAVGANGSAGVQASSGGGGGGGISATPAAFPGGAGGTSGPLQLTAAAGPIGTAGTAGTGYTGVALWGGGGAGGGSSTTGAAGAGGNAGAYGSGGGGGGAALNGFNSGAGGGGADGIVIVTCW